jgi:hypothetical protein
MKSVIEVTNVVTTDIRFVIKWDNMVRQSFSGIIQLGGTLIPRRSNEPVMVVRDIEEIRNHFLDSPNSVLGERKPHILPSLRYSSHKSLLCRRMGKVNWEEEATNYCLQ